MRGKFYNKDVNVYQAAKKRMAYIFDNFEKIIVSLSGGKDSTILTHLALEEAKERNRKVYCFFLDQEFEYNSTILHVEELMKHPNVIPLWFQIHGILPTAISHDEYWLEPWNPDEKNKWLRAQKRVGIKQITWDHNVQYSFPNEKKFGFYGLIKVMEQMFKEPVAQLVGLRAEESLDRFRAVVNNPALPDIPWSTKGNKGNVKFYPIYDWTFSDIWVYAGKNKISYNKIYNYFWKKGGSVRDMRVSSLMNRKAFSCLAELQEFDPYLYDKLLDRTQGIKTASEYANRDQIFKVKKLPSKFKTWLEYRNFLLATLPNQEHAQIFRDRFKKQLLNEYVHKQQVFQIQIHDITNSKKIINKEDPEKERKFQWLKDL